MSFFYDQASATTSISPAFSARPKTGFVANMKATFAATRAVDLSVSKKINMRDAYDSILEAVNEGRPEQQRFANPFGRSSNEPYLGFIQRDTFGEQELDQRIWNHIAAVRKNDTKAFPGVPTDRAELIRQIGIQAVDKFRQAEKIGRGATTAGAVGRFVGGAAAAITDPPNLIMGVLAAPAEWGVIGVAVFEAAMGSGAEAMTLKDALKYRDELGIPISNEEVRDRLLFAAAGGAAMGTVIKGVRPSLRVLAKGGRWTKKQLLQRFDELVPKPTAEQTAARQAAQAEVEIADKNPLEGSGPAQAEHRQRTARAGSAAENAILMDEDILPRQPLARPTQAPLENLDGNIWRFDPGEVQVDARQFQFKAGGDEFGVSDRLAGVTEWDPIKAGQVVVYEFADGRKVIADGHQRLGLARRIVAQNDGQDVALYGQLLREVDGVTPDQARVIAAVKNIAEGTGSIVDAAKVIRVAPDRLRELAPRSETRRQIEGLVNLSDDAFGMVINEVVPANFAAIAGRLTGSDPALQQAVLDVLAKTRPENTTQAESIVRQAIDAGTRTETQFGLFGEEVLTKSLFRERAKVLDQSLKMLKRERAIFATLTRNTDEIEAAGNKLATDTNQARAQNDEIAIQIIQKQANRKGPLADALGQAAKNAADNGNFAAAARSFAAAVRDAAGRGDLEGAAVRAPGRAEPVETKVSADHGEAVETRLSPFDEPAGAGAEAQAAALERDLLGEVQAAGTTVRSGETGSGTPRDLSNSGEASRLSSISAKENPPSSTSRQAPSRHKTTRNPPSSVFSARMMPPDTKRGVNINSSLESIDPTSELNIYQKVDDFNEMVDLATAHKSPLEDYLKGISEGIEGVSVFGARVKKPSEMKVKISNQGKSVAEMSDWLGGRLVVDGWQSLDEVLARLKADAHLIEIDDFLDRPRGGYRAIHVQAASEKGISVEIQIQPAEIRAVQDQSAKLRAKWKHRNPVGQAAAAEATADAIEVQRIFDDAWAKWQAHAGARPDARRQVPVGETVDADGNLVADTRTARQVLDDVETEKAAIEALDLCNGGKK